jgi:uncharacterized protein (DUF362 family)
MMELRAMNSQKELRSQRTISRRELLNVFLGGTILGVTGVLLHRYYRRIEQKTATFIAKVPSYDVNLSSVIKDGMRSLGLNPKEVHGKRILLKPNLVETTDGAVHICTHPEVVRGTAEVLLKLGAERVIVGEGSGHCRETIRVADQTGLVEALVEDKIALIDLNTEDFFTKRNDGGCSKLKKLAFPSIIEKVDWIVSIAKMKTHHWAGVTLSMKNLFGLMPGIIYGWPKNVFHCVGIKPSILDINATIRPNLAIIDGIVGMQGDGPIMGSPKNAGVLVMGRNPAAVDATAARIMEIDPLKIPYLLAASGWIGTVREHNITQRGETLASVQTPFELLDEVPAHRGLRLKAT